MDDLQRIQALARRWAQGGASFDVADLDGWELCEELQDGERAELFAWARRASAYGRRKFLCWNCHGLGQDGEPDMGGRDPGWLAVCDVCRGNGYDRDRIIEHIAELLDLVEGSALALLDAAEASHE